MRDRSIYTQEDLSAIIRHIRMYREILKDEEARILTLYESAKHFGTPVDARGKAYKERRTQYKFPETLPVHLLQALKSGETQTLPGWQD